MYMYIGQSLYNYLYCNVVLITKILTYKGYIVKFLYLYNEIYKKKSSFSQKMEKENSEGCSFTQESSKSRIYKAFKSLDLVFEATRLQTFIDWPLEKPNPSELATDGFIYTRTKDYCTCVFCWQLIQIEINDNPRQKHERIAPFCPFIRDQPVGNVPINQNTCGTIVTKSYPECDRLGVFIKRCPPKRKDYMLIEKRLKSFDVNKWPDDLTQTREDLVDAGFFYCGKF